MSSKASTRPGYLLITSLGALGVVFGDIGTSPLYAFREAFHAAEGLGVNEANVLRILSLMFWSLILVVTIKYLVFVMPADNHGEGGILALTALAERATVHELGVGFHQVLLRSGFMEDPDVPTALANITTAEFGFDPEDAVYVIGKETVIPSEEELVYRIRDRFFALMHRNATNAADFFSLPSKGVIEVGSRVEL